MLLSRRSIEGSEYCESLQPKAQESNFVDPAGEDVAEGQSLHGPVPTPTLYLPDEHVTHCATAIDHVYPAVHRQSINAELAAPDSVPEGQLVQFPEPVEIL